MPTCRCGKVEKKLHSGRCKKCHARYVYMRAFYKSHREQMKESFKRYHRKVKRDVFGLLGGCFCRGCGETNIEVLSVDHIHGGGAAHRRKLSGHGGGCNSRLVWSYVLKHPEKKSRFRVLCMGCQWLAKVKALPIDQPMLVNLLQSRSL